MYEHKAAAIVPAPVDRVYDLFAHFHQYPAVMRHVKNVTFYDDQNCHWIVDIAGSHEFDATNDGWVRNARIAWRGSHGANHAGEVLFQPLGKHATRVFVRLRYDMAGPAAGHGLRVDHDLQQDLDLFAFAVEESMRMGRSLDWETLRRSINDVLARSPVVPLARIRRGTIEPVRESVSPSR